MEGAKRPEFNEWRDELARQYVESDWYEKLGEQPRWDQYRADTTSREQWQTEFLDFDANNAAHGFINAMIAEYVCDLDGEDEQIKSLVVATSLLRDLGEAEYGDINYDAKTKDQKLRELISLSEILNSGAFPALSGEDINDLIDIRSYRPKSADSTPEVEVFQHVQRLGWLRTAMVASESARKLQRDMYGKSEQNPAQYYRLHWLAHSTLGNHLVPVIEAATARRSALAFLEQRQEQIEYCFRSLLRDDVQETLENYYEKAGLVDAARQDRKFVTAMQEWRKFQSDVLDPEFALDPERHITDLDHLRSLVGVLRKQNKSIVLTSGSYDLLHTNHMRYLRAAKERGDVLIVGLDSDEKVRHRKQKPDGPARPLIPEEERTEGVLHLRWSDYAIVKELSWRHQAVIRTIKPDVLILSEDSHYLDDRRAMAEIESICGEVVILPRMGKRTTSTTIRELMMQYGKPVKPDSESRQ